jgi:transposase InsO family protein
MNLSTACKLLGISRQAIYQQEARLAHRQKVWSKVKVMVRSQRMSMPRLGTRKLYYLLNPDFIANGIKMGRDRLFDCLRSAHMLIRPLKNYTRTTWSKHWLFKHPNLIKQMQINRAEQLWVSDITYVKTQQQGCYLSLITDAFSRRIMGYHVSEDLKTEGVLAALKMAVSDRVYRHPLIHHSDRGIQYCAEPYQQVLKENDVRCSMTDGYDCYQNALAERMNGILKNEFLLQIPTDIIQLKKIVSQSIHTYNNQRPHLSLNMKTPNQRHYEARNQYF